MTTLLRGRDVIGLPVVTLAGDDVAEVRDVVFDSESGSVNPGHGAWKRGIRIGSAKTGKVDFFIPDPDVEAKGTSAAEGVVIDSAGNIYGAEVGPRALKKYTKK